MKRHAGFDLKAVLTAIGAELRTLHSDVLSEPIPDRMAELLKQLDQPMESNQGTDNA
jgi:aminoglycoside phosphotransferase